MVVGVVVDVDNPSAAHLCQCSKLPVLRLQCAFYSGLCHLYPIRIFAKIQLVCKDHVGQGRFGVDLSTIDFGNGGWHPPISTLYGRKRYRKPDERCSLREMG